VFIAMARATGLQAYPMWVADRSQDLFQKNYLSTDQLSAYVAVLTLNGKEVYLDPGTKYCPYGMLYWPHTNTGGLRETGGGLELGQTPVPPYTDAILKRVARLTVNDEGRGDGPIAVGFFGQEALTRRIEASKTDEVGRTKLLEDEVKSWLPANADVTLTKQPDWAKADVPLIANFKISTPVLISGGKRVLLTTNVFQFGRPAMLSHSERQYPVYFEYPGREMDDIRVKLPDTLQVESLPENVNNGLDYAFYKVERKQEKNEIVIVRDLAISTFFFDPSRYKGLKTFYDKVKESDEQRALLKQVARVAQN
jgi:hypothetical protein